MTKMVSAVLQKRMKSDVTSARDKNYFYVNARNIKVVGN